jgi:putative ABC transport system permease protein
VKYLPLLWADIWRKPGRAVLMALQIVCAFALFGLLQGLATSVHELIARAPRDRLYVNSSVSNQDPLPIAARARIERIPGVMRVNSRAMFIGAYQKPQQGMLVMGTNAEDFFALYGEMQVSKAAVAAMKTMRSAAIVGRFLMDQYGWRVGDRIVLRTPTPRRDGTYDWAFDIVGVFEVPVRPRDARMLITNYDYVNEARAINRDTSDMFAVKIANPEEGPTIALAIDNAFANSAHETHTQSEADALTAQLQRVADLDYLVTGIIGAVFFALLFSTGALMMQSIRERRPELAVLKTLGFSDGKVMMLILAEALVLCVVAAATGLVIATLLQPFARQQFSMAMMPAIVLVAGAAFAVLLALLGGAIPAWRGLKLQVVDALAGR